MKNEYVELIESLVRDEYLKTGSIIAAFQSINRIDFVPQGLQRDAYVNAPLPIGQGQTISQPLTVAFMLELLEAKEGEKILDVGSGSGWTSALLAHIVASKSQEKGRKKKTETGRVIAIERLPELVALSEQNIAKYSFIKKKIVKVVQADGIKGYRKEAPYDRILAGAAAQSEVPEAWKKQLKIGGRIVAPVKNSVIVIDKVGADQYTQKEYFGFSFVPLISR